MTQPLIPFEDVGKRRKGSHAGGIPQKYILDEPGRRLILALYDGRSETISELAKRLHAPRDTVTRWAADLGLTRQKEPPWSPEEISYLEQYLHRMSLGDIAKKLGRTKVAVRLKAKRLGINKTQEGYTMRGLELALGADHRKIAQWVEKGWLKGTKRGSERPKDMWLFTDEQVRKFVFAHPQEVDPRRADWLWLVDVLAGKIGIGSLARMESEEEPD